MSGMKLCAWCRENPVKTKQARFCSRSCSAQWRMSQPETKALLYSPQVKARVGEGIRKAWALGKCEKARIASRERMIQHNPMHNLITRAKLSNILREIKHRPKMRGGKGKPMPEAQYKLAAALNWETEWVVATGRGRGHHYTIDIANPITKVAVEVDGTSHRALKRRKIDQEKDEFLQQQGWLVLRVSNDQALRGTKRVAASIVSKSAARVLTS